MDRIIIKDEKVEKLLKEAKEITMYNYGDDLGSIISALEDMIIEYRNLDTEFDDYKSEIENHCTPLSLAQEIGYRGY